MNWLVLGIDIDRVIYKGGSEDVRLEAVSYRLDAQLWKLYRRGSLPWWGSFTELEVKR